MKDKLREKSALMVSRNLSGQTTRARPDLTFSFSCLGAKICVRSNSMSVLNAAVSLLPPRSHLEKAGRAPVVYSLWSDPETSTHRLIRNGSRLGRHSTLPEMLADFQNRLHETVALNSRYIFIHAGVVEMEGRLLVFPGVSRTGKSTLVHELVRQGAVYYSDEYAVLDKRGWVHSYPKSLSLRQPDGLPPRSVPVEELGRKAGYRARPIRLIAMLRYRSGEKWSLKPMSPAETLLALMQNTLAARERPDEVLAILARTVSAAYGLRGVRGEAADAAAELLPCLAKPSSKRG